MPAFDTSRSIGPKRSSVCATAADDVGLAAHVGADADRAVAERARPRASAAAPSRSTTARPARALGREPLAQRPPDAVGAAGDEHDLVAQLHRGPPTPSRRRRGS